MESSIFPGIFGGGFLLSIFAVMVIVIIGYWKVFEKANKPGWAAIVPFYNWFVLSEIAGLSPLWFIMLFIPIANIIALFRINIGVAENFGKSAGYGVGMVFIPYILYPKLGFGDEVYLPLVQNDQIDEFGR